MDEFIILYRVFDPESRRKEVYFATLEEAKAYHEEIARRLGEPARSAPDIEPVSRITITDLSDLVEFLNSDSPGERPERVTAAIRKRRRVTGASVDRLRERPF